MKTIIKYLFLAILSVSMLTCTGLEVENINEPDAADVLASEDGVKALAGSLFNQWFNTEQHNLNSIGPALWVMADWGTVTFANYATKDMSEEPRVFLNNTPSYGYHRNSRNYWRNMYGVITTANDIVRTINNGMEIGDNGEETMMIKGMAHFMQGLGNGYIGLIFNKAYLVDENTDMSNINFETIIYPEWEISYTETINLAISQLEKAIEIFDNNSFTLPSEWMNGNTFSNTDMSKLAHSFIARLIVYSPRNTTQSETIDWQIVLNHAQAGINSDFTIEGDGNGSNRKWMSWYKYYMGRPTWGKVDMRIVHLLDATIPANWPEGGIDELPNDGVITSNDERVISDFQFDSANDRPERGLYRWSTYRYSRFDSYYNENFFAPVMMMRKTENDLFIAEAYARLGQYGAAASIINTGTRVLRGNLPTISSDPNEVNNAIFYERSIELPLTGMGIEFFDMRRNGLLQDGSLLHFPVPAQQLEIMLEPFYTFGGINPQYGVPNEDVAINGWYTP